MKKIAIYAIEANSFWERAQGLLFSKSPYVLFLRTRFGIHTFGMNCSIDVIILNNTYKIVVIKRNLPPNRFLFWNPKYRYVIEAPVGFVDKRKIKHGTLVKIHFKNE